MAASNAQIDRLPDRENAAGFVTDIDVGSVKPGLSENVNQLVSTKKQASEFLLDSRLCLMFDWSGTNRVQVREACDDS